MWQRSSNQGSPNPSGSQNYPSPQQRGGWVGRQDRQSPQQGSPGGWGERQYSRSPPQGSHGGYVGSQDSRSPHREFDLHATIRLAMLSTMLRKKISAARLPGTTNIANAFLFRMSRGGPIRNFLQLEQYACQNGMANIAALLLFVFNHETQMFQEVKRLEEDQVYLVIPSCIGTSLRRDPNDVWSANGGVGGSCGASDKQTWGSGANIDAQEVQRAIVAACDIKANPNLMRVPLERFCHAMTTVGAIPLQVEMDSQRSSPVESPAQSACGYLQAEDETPATLSCKHGVLDGGQKIGACTKCDWGE